MALTKEALRVSTSLREIIDDLSGNHIFERRPHLEATVRAILAQENVFVLGAPGTAKSLMLRMLCASITGASYFDIQLDRDTPAEAVFGPQDIKAFRDEGLWQRKVEGYAPTADLMFADEIGKAGPMVSDRLLTLILDHIYHNGSPTPLHCPLISCVGASNEELEMPEQAAFWDRFLVRLVVDRIQEPGNFMAMLAGPQRTKPPAEITLADLHKAIEVVPTITVPTGVQDSILELRVELESEGITPSDRRWVKYRTLMQAGAFLAGRDVVDDEDIAVGRDVLWDTVEQITKVERIVLAKTGPIARKAMEFTAQLDSIEKELNARKGMSVKERANYGGDANNALTEIQARLDGLIEKANREGRSTTLLDTVSERRKNLKVRVYIECLNIDEERARKLGA